MKDGLSGYKCPTCGAKIVRESQPVGWIGMAAHCSNGHSFPVSEVVKPTNLERAGARLRDSWNRKGGMR